MTQLALDAGLMPHVAEGMGASFTGETAGGPDPEPDREYAADHGWILGDGRMFPCLYFGHKDLAVRLVKMLQGKEVETGDADDLARKLNWLKVGSDADGKPFALAHGERTTRAQREAGRAWAGKHSLDPADSPSLEEPSDG
jgi:hypothetical protein